MKIHKEGYKILTIAFILFALISALVLMVFNVIAFAVSLVVLMPLFIFVLRFFRVPKREVVFQPERILSPCDGRVVAIEEIEENEFLNSRCILVSVFMSVWNVHINWYPVSGKVIYQKYHPGKFLVAWEPKSSTLNERTTVAIERADGARLLFRQIAGFIARRIVCTSEVGDSAEQGKELGFIKFGSRVDVFLPLDSAIKVKLNQKVVGTQTILAVVPTAKT